MRALDGTLIGTFFEIQSILKFEFSKMSIILKIGISKMCKILVEDKKILSLSFSIRLCVGVVWELIEPYTTRRIGSTGQIFNIRHFGFSLFWLEIFVIFCFSDFWFFDGKSCSIPKTSPITAHPDQYQTKHNGFLHYPS